MIDISLKNLDKLTPIVLIYCNYLQLNLIKVIDYQACTFGVPLTYNGYIYC